MKAIDVQTLIVHQMIPVKRIGPIRNLKKGDRMVGMTSCDIVLVVSERYVVADINVPVTCLECIGSIPIVVRS